MTDVSRKMGAVATEETHGRLGLLTFPSLVHDVCGQAHTGILTVKDGEREKSLFIEKGKIVFARSNDLDDRLGTLLFRKGQITLKDLETAGRLSAETGQRLGGVLVANQIIRSQDLVTGVREQVKAIVTSLFLWTSGDYEIKLGPLPGKEVITLKISTGDMILEGVKRIDSWSRIRLAVGDMDTRYQISSRLEELGEFMSLSLDEWTFLSRCEGPVPLSHLCDVSPLKDFEVCRLVWALTVVGLLKRMS